MSLDTDETERAARALLDNRIASVRALVEARQALADRRDEVVAAEREDVRCYSAALRDGWSAEELRKLGIGEPDKASRARRSSRKSGRERGTATPAAGEPSDSPSTP